MGCAVLRGGGRQLIGYIAEKLAILIVLITQLTTQPTGNPAINAQVPEKPVWRTFEATAYTARCNGCSGITKSGIDVRHTQVDGDGRKIIAVDPRVIPLGTALDIRIGNEIIEAVAEDTGGSIRNREIDVLMATEEDALAFGRQDVKIRIVSEETE